jgi:cytochrome b
LIPLHVGGVIHAARVHRENLVAAMLHGRKPAAAGDDVPP